MKEKLLYINFVLTYNCSMNCDYCILTKEQRAQTDTLSLPKFKLYFLQLMTFFKKHNYDKLVISLTGDELHNMPPFLDWLKEVLTFIENHLPDIPKKNIKLKMHTNLTGPEDFYLKQFEMLDDISRFCEPEFETVYQAMYHSAILENKLYFIQNNIKNYNIDYISNMGLRNESDRSIIQHLPSDYIYDFSILRPVSKPNDKEINYVLINKELDIINGCGYHIDQNLFKLQDKNFCSECSNENCNMLNDINRI